MGEYTKIESSKGVTYYVADSKHTAMEIARTLMGDFQHNEEYSSRGSGPTFLALGGYVVDLNTRLELNWTAGPNIGKSISIWFAAEVKVVFTRH